MIAADALDAIPGARLIGDSEVRLGPISFDSRQVQAGGVFVALPGTVEDGAHYVADAFARGAAMAVVEREGALPSGHTGLVVPSARLALALLSARLNGWPARSLRVAGITGTDGKTTTTSLLAAILRIAQRRVGVVTTVQADVTGRAFDTGFHTTTPDAPDLQRYLRMMVESDVQDAVLEVTSHGLAQDRVVGCEFDLAVVTNVTSDHLDFHGDPEAYLAAKLKLFESLGTATRKPGVAKGIVYNLDDRSAPAIDRIWSERRLSYALERHADVRARAVRQYSAKTAFDIEAPGSSFPVEMPLVGWYNVANALAASAAALLWDVPIEAIQEGLATFSGIPGRLERVDLGQPFDVFVDFAHTPNSLEQVLRLQRAVCQRQLSIVFGCAGLRDRQKRPVMGAIAGQFADRIYLTAEDPRTESVDDIIEQIVAGCRDVGRREGTDFWRVPDRREAIERAIAEAKPGDVVLVTGKGHERSMCFGRDESPWNDGDVVRDILESRFGATRSSANPPLSSH